MRRTLRIGQLWADPEGRSWRVVNIYRKDGRALLAAGTHQRSTSFGELGCAFELAEDPARGP